MSSPAPMPEMLQPPRRGRYLKAIAIFGICAGALMFAPASLMGAETLSGSGTGFFITTGGYFLTCFHVTKDAGKIQIKVGDTLFDARIVRVDPINDIALLKAEGEFLALPIASTSGLEIGDDVFTIGFPAPEIEGMAPKFTKGDISATSGLRDDPRFFQVSIPVQPGNSGGPLVDEHGDVVGIIDHTLSPQVAMSQGFVPQNVNYAIKAGYAVPLVETVVGLRDKLPTPGSNSSESPAGIREIARKSVGLVLVFSKRETQHAQPAIQAETTPKVVERRREPRNPSARVVFPPILAVKVLDSAGHVVYKGRTDSVGEFATGRLNPGRYVLIFNAVTHLVDESFDVVVRAGKATTKADAVPGEKFSSNGVGIRVTLKVRDGLTGTVAVVP